MTYLQAMHDYYSAQRYVGLAGALLAVLYFLIAVAAYRRKTLPARSFAITVLLIAGLLMLPATVVCFFFLGPHSAHIATTLAQSPSEFNAPETAHLNNMMNGFHRSYRLDGAVAMPGLLIAVAGFAAKSSKLIGVGRAVTLCATTLLAGEVWSKHRALRYREQLSHAFPSS